MPANTPDQQITLPIGVDPASNPVAFTNFVADVEQKLVRQYADDADRTARQLVVAENDISGLLAEERLDVYDATNNISLYTRSLFRTVRVAPDQLLTISSTALQNITNLVVPMPTLGTYNFRGVFFYDSSTTADIKFAVNAPVGVGLRWSVTGLAAAAGGATGDFTSLSTAVVGTALAIGGAGVGTVVSASFEGSFSMGGAAGNFQLQAAQNTVDATQSTIRASSILEVWRIV